MGFAIMVIAIFCVYQLGYHTGKKEVLEDWLEWIKELQEIRGSASLPKEGGTP